MCRRQMWAALQEVNSGGEIMSRINETGLWVHTFISQVTLEIGHLTEMESSGQPRLLMEEELRTCIPTRTISFIWRGCSS